MLKWFLWIYFRAAVWVALCALLLFWTTREKKMAWSFVAAHAAALGFSVLVDYFMVNIAPRSWLDISVMQWVFVAPIVIFTVISLHIGSWKRPVYWHDAFMTLAPITAWGLLVIHGWQSMWDCHVLGAWFVSAASGAADLFSHYGPDWAQKRRFTVRFAGYAMVVAAVYLLLPRTSIYGIP